MPHKNEDGAHNRKESDGMTSKQKKRIMIGYGIYYVCLILASIYCGIHQMEGLKMAPVAAFTCFLVPLCLKLLKLKSTSVIVWINLIFAFIASILGSMLGAYSLFMFDKFLHFFSGVFLSELSFMVFCYLREKTQFQDKKEKILCLLFVNACNMMIAVFWEFFEYACLIFLNNDAIRHTTSGVHDSMTDMLVACVGGILITGWILRYFKTGKKNFWIHLNEEFYHLNFNS